MRLGVSRGYLNYWCLLTRILPLLAIVRLDVLGRRAERAPAVHCEYGEGVSMCTSAKSARMGTVASALLDVDRVHAVGAVTDSGGMGGLVNSSMTVRAWLPLDSREHIVRSSFFLREPGRGPPPLSAACSVFAA